MKRSSKAITVRSKSMLGNILRKDPRIQIKSQDLLVKPVVAIVNKFNEEAVLKLANDVSESSNTGQTVLPVVIDSYGGQVYSLLAMVDILKSSSLPVATIAIGKSMSCGAILFSCGEEGRRYMSPLSTLMIHDVSSGVHGKIEEVKADSAEAVRLNELVYKLMARNVGKDDSYFTKIVHDKGHADWCLTAEDAKFHGLANHLRLPKFVTTVSVDMVLE